MSTRSRGAARAWVAIVPCIALGAIGACQLTSRALGEDCLKDQDCLSGICSQLRCAAAPPLLDGSPQETPDTGTTPGDSAAPEAAPEASLEAAPEAAPETGASDAASDVLVETAAESATDSAGDASQDATTE
jgi:hypothetical protein